MRFIATLALGACAISAQAPKRTITDAEVKKVHRSALVLDTHNDVTSRTVTGFDIGKASSEGHTDLIRYRAGGFGAQFFAVFVAANYVEGNRSAHRAMDMIDTVKYDIAGKHPNDFEMAYTAADIVRIHKKGKIASLMGIEGGHAIEDSLRLLRDFYALGIRYMTLTHSNTNNWAGSSGDIDGRTKGLTDFGKDVVREMNRLGMMVDISHVSDKTFWDALEVSSAPLLASHSSCRAISNIPRNMTDEMIIALARKGGVVQVNFGCEFLSQKSADTSAFGNPAVRAKITEAMKEFKGTLAERRAKMREVSRSMGVKTVPATLADAVAHIDHIVKIAGIDAVGIGADYDGVDCVPEGLDDVSKMPNLTRALLEKGYTAKDIRKLYGENLLRVMRNVEKARK
ncbi:MAG: membrane dipeptidase [Acidobacteria bacterium]|nr:membrane dipeptidase [Acidobacteriota bacterium]